MDRVVATWNNYSFIKPKENRDCEWSFKNHGKENHEKFLTIINIEALEHREKQQSLILNCYTSLSRKD